MEIYRNREKKNLFISKGSHINKIMNKFNMVGSKSVSTFLSSYFKLSAAL